MSDIIQNLLEKMGEIHDMALHFLESQTNVDDNFQNLIKILRDLKISDNKHEFKLFLRSILKISNNYNRKSKCITKINLILKSFEKEIKSYYSNSEIFDIFKSNKLILLFLFKEKILIIDQYIINTFIKKKYDELKYPQYFSPEIRLFRNEPWFPEKKPIGNPSWLYEIDKELPQDFEEKRERGENDSYICQLIRDDSLDEFISFINHNEISLKTKIEQSFFETNNFLIKKGKCSLINYSAFHGSIRIFKYLILNQVQLEPSIWPYAIHSNNSEIIHLLEEKNISFESKINCYEEAIKCHHNDVANYIMNNYISRSLDNSSFLLKCFNFNFITDKNINENLFFELCKYDYYTFVKYFVENGNIDYNQVHVH